MANEVQVTFSDKLNDQLSVVSQALPKEFNKVRFVQNALAVLNGNTELQKCSKSSLIEGLMKGAFLGLDFMNKEAFLINYGGTAQFQTSYAGEIKFVKKYSIRPIKDIYAKVVRKGDDFEEKIIDGHPSIDFKPVPFNDDEIIGAFAVCLFEDGGMIYEVMTTKEINAVRNNYSKASRSKAWCSSWDQMAVKTVLRRLTKHIDTDFESVEAHNAWEEGSGMEFTNTSSAIDHSNIVNAFAPAPEEPAEVFVESEVVETESIEIPENFK